MQLNHTAVCCFKVATRVDFRESNLFCPDVRGIGISKYIFVVKILVTKPARLLATSLIKKRLL